MNRERIRTGLRWWLAINMVVVGVLHFTSVDTFLGIMPPWVPFHLAMVYLSGVFEIVGGLGLLYPPTRRWAGLGLIALYIAVFPANIHMAINDVPFNGQPVSAAVRYGRLPFQFLFIAWAWWVSQPPKEEPRPEKAS